MLFEWLDAREAVEAASALADTFPAAAGGGEAIRKFLPQALREVRSRKLNFYKRAKFANALKWRLLENGVQAETATEVTQTLLLVSVTEPDLAAAPMPAPAPTRKVSDTVGRQAEEAYSRGAYLEAVDHYTRLASLRPRDADALNNLGASLSKVGRYAQAEVQFRKAIARRPNYPEAYVNLANLQISQGEFVEAERLLRRALNAKPTYLAARSSLGLALAIQGRLDPARAELDKVLRAAPRHAEALYGSGIIALTEGRFEEAEELFQRALVADPQFSRAWSGLVDVRRMTPGDKLWLKRAEQAADSLSSPAEQAGVRFAIGKYFDDIGEHAKAFASFTRANELLKTIAWPYERSLRTSFVDDMIRTYTPELLSRARTGGSASSKPIFVVGMMRSGTSLLEQILASHPQVDGAGELDFWDNVARKHSSQIRQDLLPESLRRKLADEYLNTLRQHCPDSERVVDKATVNSDYLGLIHSVFPNARILYMRRDPIDTCLSCYFQSFSAALNFSLDLADLAHHYTEHARLVSHWRKVLPPGAFLEVSYEELVANQEHCTRQVLDFHGLDWDARCLQFHETQRPVLTASRWQVRQPLYSSSVQRWRKYAKFIGPLRSLQSN